MAVVLRERPSRTELQPEDGTTVNSVTGRFIRLKQNNTPAPAPPLPPPRGALPAASQGDWLRLVLTAIRPWG